MYSYSTDGSDFPFTPSELEDKNWQDYEKMGMEIISSPIISVSPEGKVIKNTNEKIKNSDVERDL